MKKTANTETAAVVMPRPVGLDAPAQETITVTDGDFSLTLNFPAAFWDGTYFECRRRFKLVAQFGTDADKALADAWFAYEMNLCATAYWLTNDEKAKRNEAREYDKLSKRRAMWEILTPELDRPTAEPAAVEAETVSEPETEHEPAVEPETETKTEQAEKPEGRKSMNAHFDFFAGCADEDAARKRYIVIQLQNRY